MSDITKRLDLRFGAFACSVQGFDDPVAPVQQILQAMQHILEETPELGEAGISFDAAAIESLTEEVARRAEIDSMQVEITPGLVVVHRAGEGGTVDFQDDGAYGNGSDWSQPFHSGGQDADSETAFESLGNEPSSANGTGTEEAGDAAEAGTGFVNIFAPASQGTGDISAGDGGDDLRSMFSKRLGDENYDAEQAYQPEYATAGTGDAGSLSRDIFADAPEAVGGSVFADPMAAPGSRNSAAESVADDAPVNFFAETDDELELTGGVLPESEDAGLPATSNVLASFELRSRISSGTPEPAQDADTDGRVEALFGDADDQAAADERDEGFTAEGLAKTAGAESVAELMVTAAAWMVLIQGQTTFTRRDVMDVFDGLPGEHPKTLEARIKGFGKAVRDSQIIMIEDGVFGLSRGEIDRFQSFL